MLKCKEVTHIIATGEIDEFTWMKRLEMRMHLLMCTHCKEYVSQIFAMGQGVRRLFGSDEDPETLARMERDILAGSGCDNGDP
jgi:hypothetical protein